MTFTTPKRLVGALLAGALVVAACGGSAATPAPIGTPAPATAAPTDGSTPEPTQAPINADLVGAGASFPVPIYSEWISDFAAVQADFTLQSAPPSAARGL